MRSTIITALLLTVMFLCSSIQGLDQCGSRSDMVYCASREKCVHSSLVCNGDNDCGDNSDEQSCPIFHNLPHCGWWAVPLVRCLNGRCVPKHLVCNGDNDCGDNSDEHEGCSSINPHPCGVLEMEGLVRCSNKRDECRSIHKSQICNGVDDCGDYSDERRYICSSLDGAGSLPLCGWLMHDWRACNLVKKCVHKSLLCNWVDDCGDNSDERGCSSVRDLEPCGSEEKNQVRCTNVNRCIRKHLVCNGADDCGDNSDEQGCSSRVTMISCGFGAIEDVYKSCANQKCILAAQVCDGTDDCGDNSDEQFC